MNHKTKDMLQGIAAWAVILALILYGNDCDGGPDTYDQYGPENCVFIPPATECW